MSEEEWVVQVIAPAPEDSPDVRWACETASAMWSRGEREQALQWVHHAIQAATAEGSHQRADDLDRAAQELEHLPLPRRPRVTDVDDSSPASTTQATAEDPSAPKPKPKLSRTAPYKLAPDDITYLEAPTSGLLEASVPSGGSATQAGVGPGSKAVSATSAGMGPETTIEPEPAPPPQDRKSRPLPPAPSQDYESTVVNAGVPKRQDRTQLMDMRGFSPGAPEPTQAPAPGVEDDPTHEPTLAPPEPAQAPAAPVPPAAPQPPSPPKPFAARPAHASSLAPTPASLLSPRPSTDFERTVERRVPILPAERSMDKVASSKASVSTAAPSISAVSSAPSTLAPGTLGSPNLPLEAMRARRVAVAEGSGKELSLRLLDEDEAVPPGAQEALLLPIKSK